MSRNSIVMGLKSLRVKYRNREVGILALTNDGKAAFSYNKDWLETGFSISPFSFAKTSVSGYHRTDSDKYA